MNFISRFLRKRRARRRAAKGVNVRPLEERSALSADYYQGLHDKNKAYKKNNWLVDQQGLMRLIAGKTVLEFGCGNGRFTRQAASVASHVTAIDWARSPDFKDMPANVAFTQDSVLTAELPAVDMVCSGDVLEHFKKDDLARLLPRIHAAGIANYHVIACYDDHHSHLTIEPKEWWLAQFQALDPTYRLLNDGSEYREIAIISNAAA